MGKRKLSAEEKVRLSDEIEERLKPCLYLSTNWAAVTGAVFFGVPLTALVALDMGGHDPAGVPERVGMVALILEGVVYWLSRRSYYKAYAQEWEAETRVPDSVEYSEPVSSEPST